MIAAHNINQRNLCCAKQLAARSDMSLIEGGNKILRHCFSMLWIRSSKADEAGVESSRCVEGPSRRAV